MRCTCGYAIGHPLVSSCSCNPEQEPVYFTTINGYVLPNNPIPRSELIPRKEWLSLESITIRQLKDIHIPMYSTPTIDDYLKFARAIEAKLKEKNNGPV